MYAICMSFSQAAHFTTANMHTVCSYTTWTQNIICLKTIHYSHTVARNAVFLVGAIFSNMYMKTNTQLSTTCRAALKSCCTQSERCMQAITRGNYASFRLLSASSA